MKRLLVSALATTCCLSAQAGAGVMLGVTYAFGGSAGITLQLLSTDRQNRAALAAGISYYPGQSTGQFGAGLGVGSTFNRGAATLGYDFLNSRFQLGLGASNAKDRSPTAPPPPPPSPPSSSGNA